MNTFFSEDCKNDNRGHIVFQTDEMLYKYNKTKKTLLCIFDDEEITIKNCDGICNILAGALRLNPRFTRTVQRIINHLHRRVIPSTRKFGV